MIVVCVEGEICKDDVRSTRAGINELVVEEWSNVCEVFVLDYVV